MLPQTYQRPRTVPKQGNLSLNPDSKENQMQHQNSRSVNLLGQSKEQYQKTWVLVMP